jgi:hypothetical protein
MGKQKTLTIILSIINAIWIIYSINIMFTHNLSKGLFFLIPIGLGSITFLILNKIKKFETIRALKYANLVSIIPIGIILILYNLFFRIIHQPLAGGMVVPVSQQCWQMCRNTTQEVTNATMNCIENCIQNLRK